MMKKIFKKKKHIEDGAIEYYIDYAKTPGGYFTCIHINTYPSENIKEFFLTKLKDVIISIDILPFNKKDTEDNIKKAQNQADNVAYFLTRSSTIKEASNNFEQLEEIEEFVKGSALLNTHIRLYVFSKEKDELFAKVHLIRDELNKFNTSIYHNELKTDLESLFVQLSKQKNQYNKEIFSHVMNHLYHVNGISLSDKNGFLLGESITGNPIVFDPGYVDSKRKNYNILYFGIMNSGKSTLQKKLLNMIIMQGGKIRNFDSSGEFRKICDFYNGVEYNLDGSDGMINPLEIIKFSTPEESYNKNVSKLVNMYSAFSSKSDDTTLNKYSTLINRFYKSLNITRKNNFEIDNYPIFSDFLDFLNDYKKSISKSDMSDKSYNMIEEIIDNTEAIATSYSSIFNGKSTFDIKNEKVVSFNIKSLSGLPDNVFMAILFNVNSILFAEMLENNDFQEEKDIDKPLYYINFDEAHRVINKNVSQKGLIFYINFLKEARKYRAGMSFSFHRVSDLNFVEAIFDLCQYKFIFQQDANVIKVIQEKFTGVFSDTELKMIRKLAKGKCILSITGLRNIPMYIYLGGNIEKSLISTGGK